MNTTTRPYSKPLTAGLALAGLALLSTAALRAETEENIDKTFKVAPGGSLNLEIDFGSIEVTGADSDQVVVHVWRKVSRGSKAKEEAFLQERPVTFTPAGDSLTIRSKSDQKIGMSWSWTGHQRLEGKYVIRVPSKYRVDLHTAGGGILVRELTGETKAHTSGGGLEFDSLHGALDGTTSGGGIRLKDCEGKLHINTSGGGIDVAGGKGDLDGHTSGGGITVHRFDGPVRINTSGGGIHAQDVTGRLVAHTSGGPIEASLRGPLTDDIRLETSGGGIRIKLPADAAFDLDASTSAGSVQTEFPVTVAGKLERSHLHGPVNGGGKPVYLRTSAGGIQIEKL